MKTILSAISLQEKNKNKKVFFKKPILCGMTLFSLIRQAGLHRVTYYNDSQNIFKFCFDIGFLFSSSSVISPVGEKLKIRFEGGKVY